MLRALIAAVLLLLTATVGQTAQIRDIEWVSIPAGRFDMGCVPDDPRCADEERPRHQVTLSSFALTATEITAGMFRTAGAAATLAEQPPWQRDDRFPAVNVTWDEADAFCRKAGGRLPTEAEWEFAARGGRPGEVHAWGNAPTPLLNSRPSANVADESARRVHPEWTIFYGYDDGYAQTSPAAAFPAGGYGLYDMGGNVWEWVSDWFDSDYYRRSPAINPRGPDTGLGRVVRGGSWADYSTGLRLSARSLARPGARGIDVGFRCARDAR
jgi:formylglycine-generating enzyme required for sulfatase activity